MRREPPIEATVSIDMSTIDDRNAALARRRRAEHERASTRIIGCVTAADAAAICHDILGVTE